MDEMIRLATHYLIAAEASFLPSNRNNYVGLNFCSNDLCMYTRKLNKYGDLLLLNYETFTLEWRSDTKPENVLELNCCRHFEIIRWIETTAIERGIKKSYHFNENLPYSKINDDYLFYVVDINKLRQLIDYKVMAEAAIEKTIDDLNLDKAV